MWEDQESSKHQEPHYLAAEYAGALLFSIIPNSLLKTGATLSIRFFCPSVVKYLLCLSKPPKQAYLPAGSAVSDIKRL